MRGVPGKVQVDVLHGYDLCIAAAGAPPLTRIRDPGRARAAHNGVLADLAEAGGQADGRGGLTLAGGGGGDGGDEDQLSVGLVGAILQQGIVHLRLIVAVLLQVFLVNPCGLGHLGDLQLFICLGDLDV